MTDTATTRGFAASQPARHRLTQELVSCGALHSPEWISAFEETPREVFTPRFWRRLEGGEEKLYEPQDADFLDTVYTDDSLVTRWDPNGQGISSSTMPSLMALMLEKFPVRSGDRALEVGTGTGYNLALLCHRLGADNVTSIDIDPELTATARERLADLGYQPTIVTGDGRSELPGTSAYNGILATCAVRRIPTEWLRGTAPGAPIVVNIGAGVACLRRTADGGAEGTFLEEAYGFMDARSSPDEPAESPLGYVDLVRSTGGNRSVIPLPLGIGDPHDFMRQVVFGHPQEVHLNEPDVFALQLTDENGHRTYCLAHPASRSWARMTLENEAVTVQQDGPLANLASDRIQRLAEWDRAGRPAPGAYRLRVDSDGLHTLSRGDGDARREWVLPR
ncbi:MULTISPECIES: methyltransferase domain-containing protein [Streptomyces]|uniref:methyltransferase domain-containing protein n=1 Tax=Streptomyces TaxID=1883 RepID=UPI0015920F45|nr:MULTISPECIES: methyltransferase domain-containing protein [Streptomyces]QKV69292.1 methyltransferase domain-containing protein [Streptomyces harbinensis]